MAKKVVLYMEELKFLDFVRAKSGSKDGFLIELEEYAHKNNVPIIKPEAARFLEVICALKSPKNILEIGTAIGYSSMVMANALSKNVSIDTIEVSIDKVNIARKNLEKYGFSNCIRVIYGDGTDVVMHLEKKYDLIFLDSSKGQYIDILSHCDKLLNTSGILITDNIFCQGLLLDIQSIPRRKKTMVRNMNKFIDEVLSKNYRTSIISMGDGILISQKNGVDNL